MLTADDSYAGSATFTRLAGKLREVFGMPYFLPAHQGRACENLLSQTLVKPGSVVPMNYHFTTTKAHITLDGGRVEEIYTDEALQVDSHVPVQGQHGPPQAAGTDRRARRREHPVRADGGRHQPHRRPAALPGQPAGRFRCLSRARHSHGARRLTALGQPVVHQVAGGGVRRRLHRRDHPRDRRPLRHRLLLRAQDHLRPRRWHHDPRRGDVSADARTGSAVSRASSRTAA